QQRAPHLLSGPGMWATTAGYVLAGENSLTGAMRELREELSLEVRADCFFRFDRLLMNGLMQDIWIAQVSLEDEIDPKPGVEVSDWKWVSKGEIIQMIESGEFFAYS